MGVLGSCDSCGNLDLCMLNHQSKKWLCDECYSEYEKFDAENIFEDEECDNCGSLFHSTFRCDFDQEEA